MAEYQTTTERWECDQCGEVGYDIVPSHDCPFIDCSQCGETFNSEEEGKDEMCQSCVDFYSGEDYKEEKTAELREIFSTHIMADYVFNLLQKGFRIFIPDVDNRSKSYFFYGFGNQIGYCQLDEFPDRLVFSTVIKPGQETGSGFRIQSPYHGITSPNEEHAKEALRTPGWAQNAYGSKIKRYGSVEEWMKSKNHVETQEIIL